MTDYNDGKWHVWNGGECPVHPLSVIDTRHLLSGEINGSEFYSWAGEMNGKNAAFFSRECWLHENIRPDDPDGDNPIVAFRVVTPYAEPVEYSGECYALHRGSSPPILCDVPLFDGMAGKWTATHINGKLARIVWEATE